MRIERAVREQTFTLTSIAGPSGSGKTYSAILYARGLVGPEGKIGFIDTENKRSRFYADVGGGFDVIDLDPPFTSHRYVEAIRAFEDAGYKAIIIDSISHEWEGSGGVLEQADAIEQATKRSGLHCWAKPKAGHKKLMNELLQTRAHLVFCCRVKEKVVQAKVNGKTEIVNEGFVVVQEKMFIYEMSVSMMLAEGTHIPTIQKCPGDLEIAFPAGKKITIGVGTAVANWANQGVAIDPDIEAAKREGLLSANEGTSALAAWWKALGPARQAKLDGMKDALKSIATATDQLKTNIHEAGGGDFAERLSAAKAQGSPPAPEGFALDYVTDQTADAASEAGSGHSEASGDMPGNDPGGEEGGASAAGDLFTESDVTGQDDTPPAPALETVSDADKAWLVTVFKVMKAAVGPSVSDFRRAGLMFKEQREGKPIIVQAKATKIREELERCCGDDPQVGTVAVGRYVAGIIGVDERELAD